MSPSPSSPPSVSWARLLVDALAGAGLRHVCLAPGSRSTPLALAFHAHPQIAIELQLDERSAGFLGLGLALATGRPVALVCTSGTAAANFFPAVIEANMSQVPLLVLTADRPPELRHSGANQTIDQVKLYGDHVLWAVDLDVPTGDAPESAHRNLIATAGRAYALADGLRRGPVHLNVPFRKPLEEGNGQQATGNRRRAAGNGQQAMGVVQIERGGMIPSRSQIETLTGWVNRYERGLIVCGPGCPGGDFPAVVLALAEKSGYPIAADPLSGLRYGAWTAGAPLLCGYETLLSGGRNPGWEPPDIVIRFGQVPTGRWLNQYLETIDPAVRLHVRASGVWADDSHRTTDFWQADEAALCRFVSSLIARGSGELFGGGRAAAAGWAAGILQREGDIWRRIERALGEVDSDAAVVAALFEHLPDPCHLVVGNSLPIRQVDQFGRSITKHIRVFGNRGASGIDGVVSTAVGVARSSPAVPTVLLIGDISFFHDQNGLLAARRTPNLKIVLLNNNGGGIFRRLPVAAIEPPFKELFLTPHDLDFGPVVAMYGLEFSRTSSKTGFVDAFTASLALPGAAVVEYTSDSAEDERRRRALVEQVLNQDPGPSPDPPSAIND